jgi:hypothetical protein
MAMTKLKSQAFQFLLHGFVRLGRQHTAYKQPYLTRLMESTFQEILLNFRFKKTLDWPPGLPGEVVADQ